MVDNDDATHSLLKDLQRIEDMKQTKLLEIKDKINSFELDDDLIFFYGASCPYTAHVAPAVTCLEFALGKQITRKEVYGNATNQDLYRALGGEEKCGGVPFFYNKKSGSTVCGARTCRILQEWAKSTAAKQY